jgi:hypothetical protein
MKLQLETFCFLPSKKLEEFWMATIRSLPNSITALGRSFIVGYRGAGVFVYVLHCLTTMSSYVNDTALRSRGMLEPVKGSTFLLTLSKGDYL